MIKLRETKPSDAKDVTRLLQANEILGKTFPVRKIRSIIKHNKGLCFVATEKEKIIGSIFANHDGGLTGHIHKLAIHPDFRRKKIASKLLQKAIQKMKRDGITLIFGHVKRKNIPSIRMLESNGFEKRKTHYLMDLFTDKK